MKKIMLPSLALALVAIACKKEDTRGVTYKAECQHCWVQYDDANGGAVDQEVNGAWEKRLSMESGQSARISVCGYNNPVGGTTSTLPPQNSSTVWIFVDNNVWSEKSASTAGSRIDTVVIYNVTDTLYRTFYADTCTSVAVVIPEK